MSKLYNYVYSYLKEHRIDPHKEDRYYIFNFADVEDCLYFIDLFYLFEKSKDYNVWHNQYIWGKHKQNYPVVFLRWLENVQPYELDGILPEHQLIEFFT